MKTGVVKAIPKPVDAGDFDLWLAEIWASFRYGSGSSVPCGTCRGCCTSSYFVHVRPEDDKARTVIPKHLLMPALGMPSGHSLMGYNRNGHCVMLKAGDCSIYARRPSTCRSYDCRIFTAAGLSAGGAEKFRINERVNSWTFQYASSESRNRHRAIEAAARFIHDQKDCFPGGKVPTEALDLAVLAIKVHPVFLQFRDVSDPRQVAQRIIEASKEFEASVSLPTS